jgi:vacuolar-type H+-ATPase subunit I/STV1
MRYVVGGLLVLGGAALIAAGVVNDMSGEAATRMGRAGYPAGVVLSVVGVAVLIASLGRRRRK